MDFLHLIKQLWKKFCKKFLIDIFFINYKNELKNYSIIIAVTISALKDFILLIKNYLFELKSFF